MSDRDAPPLRPLSWLATLQSPPPALTGRQQLAVWIAALLAAASRFVALSRTLWDWDEALFCCAIRSYDVTQHHPHPPGFPLFVAAAKLVRPLFPNDFRAVQGITALAAIFFFPALFWLLRELRFRFEVAFSGALLFVFFPTVWFFGGTAFSDVPGTVLVIAACAMLLRGCRDPRAFLWGNLLLGCAMSVRAQTLLVAAAPLAISSWIQIRRSVRRTIGGWMVAASIVLVMYGGAALASSSMRGYMDATRGLSTYLRTVDSYLNPERPPITSLFLPFFVDPMGPFTTAAILASLAALSVLDSLIRRRPEVWMMVALFLPTNLFAWFMLDINSIKRYSVGYLAMCAVLSSDAIVALLSPLRRWSKPAALGLGYAAILLVTVRMAVWTWPALRVVRRSASPPAGCMRWILENAIPNHVPLYIHIGLDPYTDYFLAGQSFQRVQSESEIPASAQLLGGYFAKEGASSSPGALLFSRQRLRIWDIVRQRYFEVVVVPLRHAWIFEEGWYEEENAGSDTWRWMGRRSRTLLPPLSGRARLALSLGIPSELVPLKPSIEVRLNGSVIGRLKGDQGTIKGSWDVDPKSNAANELTLETDRVINPEKEHLGSDPRDLGVLLQKYSWQSVGAAGGRR